MLKKIITLSTILALTACGESSEHKAMKQAINEAAEFRPICLPYALQGNLTLGSNEIDLLKRDNAGNRTNEYAIEQMDHLVEAGLYTEGKERKMGEGDHIERHNVYNITDLGKTNIRIGHYGTMICVGHIEADKINFYTTPTPDNGYTISQVNYKAKIVPEKWAKRLLDNDKTFEKLNQYTNNSAVLVKTNDGWRDIHQLH